MSIVAPLVQRRQFDTEQNEEKVDTGLKQFARDRNDVNEEKEKGSDQEGVPDRRRFGESLGDATGVRPSQGLEQHETEDARREGGKPDRNSLGKEEAQEGCSSQEDRTQP